MYKYYFNMNTFVFPPKEKLPKPPKELGKTKTCKTKKNEKHTYFHCRSMLR